MLICYGLTMLTRAFLILLAMMTGLTAAQAAEATRPAQNAPTLSAPRDVQVSAEIALASKQRQRLQVALFAQPARKTVQRVTIKTNRAETRLSQRTYISDRARL